MNEYLVVWEINLGAKSPEEAAREARKIQLDPNSMADHFRVYDPFGNVTEIDADGS